MTFKKKSNDLGYNLRMSLYACQNVMSVLNGFSKLRRKLALGEKFLKIEELRLAVLEPHKIYNEK